MMNDHQTALCSLLLGSFPSFASGDAEAALTAYELVLNQADDRDLHPGIMILINGEYPGHDGRFAPTAPQLASAIRIARNKRLEHERIMRAGQPQLPAPEIVKTPEQRERAKAKIAEFVASQGPSVTEQHVNERDRAERLARHDDFFADDFVPTGGGVGRISRTLAKKLGYSVGSPESDDAAA